MICGTREPRSAIMHDSQARQVAGVPSTDLLSYLMKALVACLVYIAAGRATETVCGKSSSQPVMCVIPTFVK